MNLTELKKMIAEEYAAFQNEQAEPAVDVAPGDVDVDGDDENSEETLRQIYDMLKDYFEGDKDADADADAGADADTGMEGDLDGDGDVDADDAKELQERFKKLANIIKG